MQSTRDNMMVSAHIDFTTKAHIAHSISVLFLVLFDNFQMKLLSQAYVKQADLICIFTKHCTTIQSHEIEIDDDYLDLIWKITQTKRKYSHQKMLLNAFKLITNTYTHFHMCTINRFGWGMVKTTISYSNNVLQWQKRAFVRLHASNNMRDNESVWEGG